MKTLTFKPISHRDLRLYPRKRSLWFSKYIQVVNAQLSLERSSVVLDASHNRKKQLQLTLKIIRTSLRVSDKSTSTQVWMWKRNLFVELEKLNCCTLTVDELRLRLSMNNCFGISKFEKHFSTQGIDSCENNERLFFSTHYMVSI